MDPRTDSSPIGNGRHEGRTSLRALTALSGLLSLACVVQAQSLGEVAAQERQRRDELAHRSQAYTEEALEHRAPSSGTLNLVSVRKGNHVAESKPYMNFPPGTSLEECRQKYRDSLNKHIGDSSGACNCPDLRPSGKVVAVEFLGEEDRHEFPDQVSFGMSVRWHCACPASPSSEDAGSDLTFSRFKDSLKRLKTDCVHGRQEYCRPFAQYLDQLEGLCDTRFADEPSCKGHVASIRSASPGRATTLAKGTVEHRETYNMPCSGQRLPTCEQCIQFQMDLTDSVESVGRERCKKSGFPRLVSYRNVSCSMGKGGPNPVYEASCGR